MADPHCTACQSVALQAGFVEDAGQSTSGYARWIAGPLQTGILGGAKRLGKTRYPIAAYRCTACGHLDLYVATDGDADDD